MKLKKTNIPSSRGIVVFDAVAISSLMNEAHPTSGDYFAAARNDKVFVGRFYS